MIKIIKGIIGDSPHFFIKKIGTVPNYDVLIVFFINNLAATGVYIY